VTESELYQHPGWQWCTPEGARKQVLALGLQTTLREKLEWLEEAETLSLRFRALSQSSAWRVRDDIATRAKRGNLEDFDRVIAKVPEVPPLPGHELPPGYVKLE
jgi:hypothetical protein